MPELIIQAEDISKKYRLGVLNSGSLKQDINDYWKGITGTPKRVSEVNEIWALKDINFSIKKGEVVGFVGRNGAGKSTLLKILSRVTLPTTGSIKGMGKIASMLDVGTGFHPELTGRENIFLNGHILGMKKKEIIDKFDEIVDFSGVEKFIDTPVKRYSSGMYVRLAFAVAAHLDPDILIVDEALAVGDADFQAKCIRKMKNVSAENGKSVLFVSHHMQAMRDLCQRIIYIDHGKIVDDGPPAATIANYLTREKIQYLHQEYETPQNAPGNEYIRIKKVAVKPGLSKKNIDTNTPLQISFEFWEYATADEELLVSIRLFDFSGSCIFDMHSSAYRFSRGLITGEGIIPAGFLNTGSYYVSFEFIKNNTEKIWAFEACLSFDMQDADDANSPVQSKGFVKPAFPVSLKFVDQ